MQAPGALVLLLSPLLSAAPPAPQASELPPGAPIRLLERLDEARIDSALAGVEPARDLTELADPIADRLLEEPFEDFEFEFAGWPQVSFAEVAREGENAFLRLDGFSTRVGLGWTLPVQPDAFYSFERSVRVRGEPFCDLYVVESRLEMDFESDGGGIDPGLYFLAGRGVALKVHRLPVRPGASLEGGTDEWQHGRLSFYPTPRTRSLVVLFRPRVGADPGTRVSGMDFDDVVLEEVLPTREERMALLKGRSAAPGEDPERGMRKAGWLLPLPSPEGVQEGEAAESNYDWRRALYAPPPTELAFDVRIPAGARLRLATGLARETPWDAAARFEVALRPAGEAQAVTLFEGVRTARMEEWHWEEVELDLEAWSGREATLVLRTSAASGDPHPLWANPRLEPAAGEADPLVILIAVDTLRADRLGAWGYERETSPALDRLAAEGVRFAQARSNCNWTCPSFASIFTGLVPSRHGVTSYGPATPLPEELVTLAEHFQNRGWATRSIAYKVPLFDGNYEQGFDQAFNVPRDVIRGEENVARALEWLEDHRGGPSFLFLHFNDPHQPFVQPQPFDRHFGPAPEELGLRAPVGIPGPDQEDLQRHFADLYDGAVAYVDDCIGRFLEALRERGLYEGATIAFVADHGEQLWEHGRFGHGGDHLYDEIVRVPLIVKPPAGACEPRVIDAEVSAFDVMPTLLELASIEPEAALDARSLVPLMSGERDRLDRPVVTETSERGLCLVEAGYKLVLEPGGRTEALFHLAEDPAETRDLAAAEPGVLARLRARAIAYVLEHRPGNYLLVRSGSEPATLTASTRALRPLVGPSLRVEADGSGGAGCRVRLDAEAWALLEVEGAGADAVRVSGLALRGPELGFDPWTPGRLAELQGPGLWRAHGPRRSAPDPTRASGPEEPVDLEMLEALRRLGYAE